MKPILMNINEISDSREVYDSRPNPFFAMFIYTILGIVAIALIWAYFGRIDIVVKSEGMLRPNSKVATIVNTYGGTLESVSVTDGSFVEEGDILYIIEHQDLLAELDYYNEQLSDTEKTITMLNKYKQSIEDGMNHFSETSVEEEYYTKVRSYLINYGLAENDLAYTARERELNLASVTKQIDIMNGKLKNTQILKEAINKNTNLFSKSSEGQQYYNRFLKYQSDYKTLNQKYASVRIEIENSTTEEGLVNSYDYYSEMLQGLQKLKGSIENGESLFEEDNSYSLRYEEYLNKITEQTTAYQQAKDNYEINKALEGLAVSEWEVEQSKIAAEDAKRAIDTYKLSFMNSIISNISETEKNIEDISLNKESILSKDKLLEQNEEDRKAALDNFKLQYLLELDNTINSLTDNISSLEINKESLELQGEKVLIDEDGTEANLSEYRNRELATTIINIDTYESKKREQEVGIEKINTQKDSAVVKATMSGLVNSNIELVDGNYLQSGVEVLSIIPEKDSDYKVNIYVSNEKIGMLKQDMKVRLNVYALPNSEYGYLTGTIVSISKDLKVDNNSGSAYYLVEAKLDNSKLYNSKGQEGNLKAGMACQAHMITENKKIMFFLLEKLNLWMDK